MFKTALRNVLARKARLMMTALAVLLGVAFVSSTFVFSDTLDKAFRATSAKSLADVAVSIQSHGKGDDGSTGIDDRLAGRIRALPGVSGVRTSVTGRTVITDKDRKRLGNGQGNRGTNYAPGSSGEDSRYPLKSGRGPQSAGEMALDAQSVERAGFQIGDTIRLAVNGPVLEKKLVGVVTTNEPFVIAGGSLALFDTRTAQKLLATPGYFDELMVSAKPGTDQAKLTRTVKKMLPDDVEARSGRQLRAEQDATIETATKATSKTLLVFSGVALFVGVFIIANTFTALITQRTRELALLRAIGASRRQVTRMVLVEATVLGLVASMVGLILGIGLAVILRAVLNANGAGLPDGPLVVDLGTISVSLAVGVAVTVLSAWLPSRRAAKISPVEAMSAVDQPPKARGLMVRNLLGTLLGGAGVALLLYVSTLNDEDEVMLVMTGAALTMTGAIVLAPALSRPLVLLTGKAFTALFGISGKLAQENALRNPRRTAATASALMIGLTLITALTVVGFSGQQGIDKLTMDGVAADYQVSTISSRGLSPEEEKKIAEVPGVAVAAPFRTAHLVVDDLPISLTGTDTGALPQVADLKLVSGSLEDLGKDRIAVSQTTARNLGWRVGQSMRIAFDDGEREAVRVGAVYQDTAVVTEVVGALSLVDRHSSEATDEKVLVRADEGAVEGLGERISETLGDNPLLKVQNRDEISDERSGKISVVLNLVYGLLGMTLVIAVTGVVNTLVMSVFERTREIGMLRAIGFTQEGIRQMVRLESVTISLFGAVLGIGIGVFIAWSVGSMPERAFPEYQTVVPWARIGLFFLAALAVGLLAAVWPARRAARVNTLEAIGAS